MEAKAGVVNKLLIGIPILAMALIGVLARSATPDYGFVAYDLKQNAAILSYIPLVKETRTSLKYVNNTPAPIARKVAREWIAGAESGKLPSMQPVSLDDTTRDGVKAEIVRANMMVGDALARDAYLEVKAGQPDQAAKDAALGALALQITKYSDFASVTSCSIIQRRCLQRIQDVQSTASKATLDAVKKQLSVLNQGDVLLSQMAVRQRQLFLQDELRHGETLATIAQEQKTLTPDEFTQPDNVVVVEHRIRTDLVGWRSQPFAFLLTDIRLGYESQVITDKKLFELLEPSKIYTL